MKKQLKRDKYKFLLEEFEYLKNQNKITKSQEDEILQMYEIKKGLQSIQWLFIIGSILVGLGLLNMLSVNWVYLDKFQKLLVVSLLMLSFNFLAFKLENNYPKTSRAMMYLSLASFATGSLLLGKIFNYSMQEASVLIFLVIGIIPSIYFFKDPVVFIIAQLILGELILIEWSNVSAIVLEILIIILYLMSLNMKKRSILVFINNVIILSTVFRVLSEELNWNNFFILILFFILGVITFYCDHEFERNVFQTQSLFIMGIAGFGLSFKEMWNIEYLLKIAPFASLIFGIAFIIYMLLMIQKKDYRFIFFLQLMIARYYFGTFYSIFSKSIFFILGGALLLVVGYRLEKLKRKVN